MLRPLSLIKKLPVFLFVYLITIEGHAQVFNTSISGATGGTGRAAVQAGDALYLNAASLVHLRGRHFYSSVNDDEWMVSLSDNGNVVIPAALGYFQQKVTALGQEVKQQDLSLALADFVYGNLSMGVTGHYMQSKLDTTSYQQTNADIGLMWIATPSIGLAVVGYNVIGENKDIPEELRLKSSVGFGFNYVYQNFLRARLDATTDSVYGVGLESYLNKFSLIRLGYENYAEDDRKLWTVGLGFEGPIFGLSYAYRGNPDHSSDYRHSVDLQIPF